MKTLHRAATALVCGLAALCGPAVAADQPACKLTMVASLDLTESLGDMVTVPAVINGFPTRMMVDTGGVATMIGQAMADKLALHHTVLEHGTSFTDFAGNPIKWIASIDNMTVGNLHAKDVKALIEPAWMDTDIAGVVGPDLLMQFDVEIDFAKHKMNLFAQDHCPGQVVYWTHDPVAVIPVRIDEGGHIIADITLDGQPLKAIVDTGATASSLKLSTAKSMFGVDETSQGAEKAGVSREMGQVYRYPFKKLELAGMSFVNPPVLLFGDSNPGAETFERKILLGRHELSKLHLFISYKERQIYATAAGAQ
jgi:predicted aspartyl protease